LGHGAATGASEDPTPQRAAFREAHLTDLGLVLDLVREFTALQTYPFDEPRTRRALAELLASPSLGRIWLTETEGRVVGYLALCFGFSIEYGGRDALVDELYVRSSERGKGLGRAMIQHVLGEAVRLGVVAVHLEVERANPEAERLYRSLGFQSNDRRLMTKRV
jgi:GNAT superfamily N-acetyltransferase